MSAAENSRAARSRSPVLARAMANARRSRASFGVCSSRCWRSSIRSTSSEVAGRLTSSSNRSPGIAESAPHAGQRAGPGTSVASQTGHRTIGSVTGRPVGRDSPQPWRLVRTRGQAATRPLNDSSLCALAGRPNSVHMSARFGNRCGSMPMSGGAQAGTQWVCGTAGSFPRPAGIPRHARDAGGARRFLKAAVARRSPLTAIRPERSASAASGSPARRRRR